MPVCHFLPIPVPAAASWILLLLLSRARSQAARTPPLPLSHLAWSPRSSLREPGGRTCSPTARCPHAARPPAPQKRDPGGGKGVCSVSVLLNKNRPLVTLRSSQIYQSCSHNGS